MTITQRFQVNILLRAVILVLVCSVAHGAAQPGFNAQLLYWTQSVDQLHVEITALQKQLYTYTPQSAAYLAAQLVAKQEDLKHLYTFQAAVASARVSHVTDFTSHRPLPMPPNTQPVVHVAPEQHIVTTEHHYRLQRRCRGGRRGDHAKLKARAAAAERQAALTEEQQAPQ